MPLQTVEELHLLISQILYAEHFLLFFLLHGSFEQKVLLLFELEY